MKKLTKFITLLGVITVTTAIASYFTIYTAKATVCHREFYPETAMVTQVNEDLITVVCQNGNVFQFKEDTEEWIAGDICSMIMDNNRTISVYDDKVVSTRYSGYVNDDEMNSWVK